MCKTLTVLYNRISKVTGIYRHANLFLLKDYFWVPRTCSFLPMRTEFATLQQLSVRLSCLLLFHSGGSCILVLQQCHNYENQWGSTYLIKSNDLRGQFTLPYISTRRSTGTTLFMNGQIVYTTHFAWFSRLSVLIYSV